MLSVLFAFEKWINTFIKLYFVLFQERGNVESVVNGIILQVLKGIRKNNIQETRMSINVNYVGKHLQLEVTFATTWGDFMAFTSHRIVLLFDD